MHFDPNEVGMRPAPFKHTIYNALVMPRPLHTPTNGIVTLFRLTPKNKTRDVL